MPFTFAHPAAVLPFSGVQSRWISLTALVIGSMAPDFEYFIRMHILAVYSHQWLGLWRFELPMGFCVFLLWQYVVKKPLIDHLPVALNRRLSVFRLAAPLTTTYGLVVIYSIIIGAATHLLWDGFTHPGGYFVGHWAALRTDFGIAGRHIYVYKLLQHGSTFLGFTAILILICSLLKGNDTRRPGVGYWLGALALMGVVLLVRLLGGLPLHQYGDVIVTGIAGLGIGLVMMSVINNWRTA